MDNKVVIKLSVAEDFSKFPSEGASSTSGASFRSIIRNCLNHNPNAPIHINLDGTIGYASNWLEAAFGGLDLEYPNRIIILSSDDSLIIETNQYLKDSLFNKPKAYVLQSGYMSEEYVYVTDQISIFLDKEKADSKRKEFQQEFDEMLKTDLHSSLWNNHRLKIKTWSSDWRVYCNPLTFEVIELPVEG
jgi:hypothetical protein